MQSLLRNPLAEPYLLGVSNGAALGTMLAFVLFADERLEFGRGLSSEDEADLCRTELNGEIDLWIDIGATSREDAEQMVTVGDPGVIDSRTIEFPNGRIVSRSIDDRIGAFVVLEALRRYAGKPGAARVVAVAAPLLGAIQDVVVPLPLRHRRERGGVGPRAWF